MRPSDFNLSFRANEESECLKYKTIKKDNITDVITNVFVQQLLSIQFID